MKTFVQQHGEKILGVLSCFDRLRFRGSLRLLCNVAGVASWLSAAGVLLKEFVPFAKKLTAQLREGAEQLAEAAGRPVRYLASKVDKEELVEQIRVQHGVADNGLVTVLSTLETCQTCDIFRNRATQQIELRRRIGKCLHYYFYFLDGKFGLTHVRLMTWFPFDVRVVMNGHEWLARDMDRAGVGYLRRDNCFVNIDDFAAAQKLADRQPRIGWSGQLERLLRRVHPEAGRFAGTPRPVEPLHYYWTSEQTEWATDLAFRDTASLAALFPLLARHGMETFGSPDVMRFLGHKLPAHGGVHGRFAGEVVSDLKQRPEGLCLRHRAEHNRIKMYDKFGSVLRVETTLNDPKGLKAYRTKQDAPDGPKQWLPLRKSVADLARRAQLSQSSNERYLEALGRLDCDAPLSTLTDKLCRPVQVGKRRHRGLRPFDPDEVRLLETVSRGEYEIAGFRNRDVRVALYGASEPAGAATPTDPSRPASCAAAVQRRRQASRVSRKLALLRAHGLIKKIPRTQRYLLTAAGRTAIALILAARNASPRQLMAA